MSFSEVAVAPGAFCMVYQSGGQSVPLHNGVFHVTFKADNSHNCLLYMDGKPWSTSPTFVAQFETGSIRITVPADGRTHSVRIVDPGGLGTVAAQSADIPITPLCNGVVYHQVNAITQNQATNEQYVEVLLSHTNLVNAVFDCRILLDGSTVQEVRMEPGAFTTRQITIPADNASHLITAEVKIGSYFADDVVLWYVIQGNEPPPVPPDPSDNATEFIPGETVIIQSSPTSTPLANDGSEWVLLEISPRHANNWTPLGDGGGMVMPLEDGTWSTTIFTNPVQYPVGSEWDVRARRFRDFRESDYVIHYFDMVDGTVPEPPKDGGGNPIPTMVAPVITGPLNRRQAGGTWLKIYGTGTPGSRLEFRTEVVSTNGRGDYTPQDCTVGGSGKWETMVYAKKQADPNDSKILGYRGRMRQNNMFSDWSNRLDVTWYHAKK